ncbi:unnamed protein product [Tuber aestivum]|uniref:Uncharacterized protein n=1 Tax=Tuber aestivum TaxID=59557 RepID=A0A292PTV8_9PEZI|nr:unnamed protein product [Tuber aestivum]
MDVGTGTGIWSIYIADHIQLNWYIFISSSAVQTGDYFSYGPSQLQVSS